MIIFEELKTIPYYNIIIKTKTDLCTVTCLCGELCLQCSFPPARIISSRMPMSEKKWNKLLRDEKKF